MSEALEVLLDLLDLEPLEENLFRGFSPPEDRVRVFGGQVAAQALVAAGRTVEAARPVHSLQSYFLRPGDPNIPIVFEVDRLRDGKSFTTRAVKAIQNGKAIFNLSASFHIDEVGPEYLEPMPEAPAPEDLPTFNERAEPYLDQLGPEAKRWITRERPIDMRPVDDPRIIDFTPREAMQDVWIKTNGLLPDDPLLHACIAVYASDLTLIDTILLPHGIGYASGTHQLASLDHAMWFHRAFHFDEWMLYHQSSPTSGGARGFARGEFFRRDGVLAISVAQEGLIRPR